MSFGQIDIKQFPKRWILRAYTDFERTAATAYMQLPKREIICGDKIDLKNMPRFLSSAMKDDLHVAYYSLKIDILGFECKLCITRMGDSFIEVKFILPLPNSVPLFLCFPIATINK